MRLLELGAVACRLPIGYRVLLALFQWIVAEMRWLAYKLKAYRDTSRTYLLYTSHVQRVCSRIFLLPDTFGTFIFRLAPDE